MVFFSYGSGLLVTIPAHVVRIFRTESSMCSLHAVCSSHDVLHVVINLLSSEWLVGS